MKTLLFHCLLCFRILMTQIIEFNRYGTLSGLINATMQWIFVVQFFNTAILLLLVNANLQEVSSFLAYFFGGRFNDFSQAWYHDIGTIFIETMLINAFSPLIEFAITVKYLFKLLCI